MIKGDRVSAAVVRQMPLFRTLDEAQAAHVAALLQVRSYRKGDIICHQGDQGSCMYVVLTGRVRIYVTNAAGREITVRIYGQGMPFGELAALDGGPRSASTVALSDVTTLVLYREDLLALLRQHFALVERVVLMLTERVRHTTLSSRQLVFMSVPARVAALLEQLTGPLEATDQPEALRLDMTQQELATIAGTSSEWLNRVLHSFAAEGLIRIERGTIVVLDRAGLAHRAQAG